MQKKYKFITIEDANSEFNGKPQYFIKNNKSQDKLGILFYYPAWKQYVFTQYKEDILFNFECLLNVVDFMNLINK